ncbi:MAG: MAPEG family protein [Gammaproteobacteria bacterium]|nr:MAPEG family protein [Gammaproteobacteria bacterium]
MEFIVAMLSLVTWTVIVWWALLLTRLSEIKVKKLFPHQLNTPEEARELLSLRQHMIARNFSNLTELPVLFYALATISFLLEVDSQFLVALAWGFVATRIAHTLIHTGYNNVLHRFYAYFSGGLILSVWVLSLFAMYIL